ncbi:MAG: peptidoglycan DD-metalloendopeptidase family protein [Desulfobacterales bacterium]|nr:peptidoglycan DD-metalloendopeptidase family protein [Desulfobacterales bacterium]
MPVAVLKGMVKSGDTAATILKAYLPLTDIYSLERQAKKVFPLTRLRIGNPYAIHLIENNFIEFEYEINGQERLVVRKNADGYDIERLPIEYEVEYHVARIKVESTLAQAFKSSGEPYLLSMKLSDIFSWDIDFAKDIREGDHAEFLVEKLYRHGEFVGYGEVLAAFFSNRGIEYQAFMFKGDNTIPRYFDEEGNSLEKAFLKAPLKFSRISSGFTNRRLHPILKIYRPHTSIDFAAPRNTPIRTVADGTILKKGYTKTKGRYMVVRHANGYETQYLHMNHFARGLKKGGRVTQGEIIGYVGKTGLATGYHLDFSLRKNGRPVNPLTVDLPKGSPVPDKHMTEFKSLVDRWSQKIRATGHLAAYDQ